MQRKFPNSKQETTFVLYLHSEAATQMYSVKLVWKFPLNLDELNCNGIIYF